MNKNDLDVILIESSDEEDSIEFENSRAGLVTTSKQQKIYDAELEWWTSQLNQNVSQRQYLLSKLDEVHFRRLSLNQEQKVNAARARENNPNASKIPFKQVFNTIERCSSCLRDQSNVERMYQLKCYHHFCCSCFSKWTGDGHNVICLVCKSIIFKRD